MSQSNAVNAENTFALVIGLADRSTFVSFAIFLQQINPTSNPSPTPVNNAALKENPKKKKFSKPIHPPVVHATNTEMILVLLFARKEKKSICAHLSILKCYLFCWVYKQCPFIITFEIQKHRFLQFPTLRKCFSDVICNFFVL